MDSATIVAIVILVGVFILMVVTIWKAGVDAAIKLWGVMGALTGVAFGAITSFYFTNNSNQLEIRQAQLQKQAALIALNDAALKADEANKLIIPFASVLKGELESSSSLPFNAKLLSSISKQDRLYLGSKVKQASEQLIDISALNDKVIQMNYLEK